MKYKVGDRVYLKGLKGVVTDVKNKGLWLHRKQIVAIDWSIGCSELSSLKVELKPLITLPATIN